MNIFIALDPLHVSPRPWGAAKLLLDIGLPLAALVAVIPVFVRGNNPQRLAAVGLSFIPTVFLLAALGRIASIVFGLSS